MQLLVDEFMAEKNVMDTLASAEILDVSSYVPSRSSSVICHGAECNLAFDTMSESRSEGAYIPPP